MPRRKHTIETVTDIIESEGYVLFTTNYINNKQKLEIFCYKCNNSFFIRFERYLLGSRCSICSIYERGINQRIREDHIIKMVQERGETFIKCYYKDDKLRIEYKCNKCDELFDVSYYYYKSKKECRCIKKDRIINYEYVKEYISEKGDCIISNEYIRAKNKLEIKCGRCDQVFLMTWDDYQGGRRCGKCSRSYKKTYDYVKQYIETHGDTIISKEYVNNKNKITIRCGKCEYIYEMTIANYQNGKRCIKCGRQRASVKRSLDPTYVESIVSKYGDKLISSYKNSKTKIDVECQKCGNIYKVLFYHFRDGSRCLCNTISKGEMHIEDYLKELNIEYRREKTFEECKNERQLRFDFYLPVQDLLIEFDGIQHFKPVKAFGGEKYLKDVQINDLIKNEYCFENNKYLLRICYKNLKNVKEILSNYLKGDDHEYIEYSHDDMYANMMNNTDAGKL